MVAVTTSEDHLGRDAGRPAKCFIFYKTFESTGLVGSPTTIAECDCKTAEKIEAAARYPRIDGFSDLSDTDKGVLDSLSQFKWSQSNIFTDEVFEGLPKVEITFKKSFQFEFRNHYQGFNFYSPAESDSHTGGGYSTEATFPVRQLGHRANSDGTVDFLVLADAPGFFWADDRRLEIDTFLQGTLEAKKYTDIEKIQSSIDVRTFYRPCYGLIGCENDKSPTSFRGFRHADYVSLTFSYMILHYDPSKPNALDVQFHLVNPKVPSVTLHFEK